MKQSQMSVRASSGRAALLLGAVLSCAGPGSSTPSPEPREPQRVEVCKLLPSMEVCWSKARDLLARLTSCGQLAEQYGEGVKEIVAGRGLEAPELTAKAATFACAGLCGLKRNEPDLTWADACRTAVVAMSCDPSICASGPASDDEPQP